MSAPNPSPARPSLTRLAAAGAVGAGVAALLVAAPAAAHPGATGAGAVDGILHPFTGLDHLLAMVAVGALAVAARTTRGRWLTPAGFVAGMVAGGVLGLTGFALPSPELFIAASVLVFGVLLVTLTEHDGVWLPLLAAAFGLAHGVAHGAEIPAAAVPALYVAGFVVATVALHAAGTSVGLVLRRSPTVRAAAGAAVTAAGVSLLLGV